MGILFAVLALFVAVKTVYGVSYPNYKGYVNDFADIIPQDVEQRLENKLSDYEKKTTYEIAVVTVKSLDGLTVEDYSIGLAEKWKVGKADADNGVIFLTAVDDRKTRIEVGNGIEDKLTDIESGRILDKVTPYYKEGKYGDGVETGVNKITAELTGDQILDGIATESAATTDSNDVSPWVILIILLVVFGIPGLLALAASPYTPIGGQGTSGITGIYVPTVSRSTGSRDSFFSKGSSDSTPSGGFGSFGGFGGGSFGGGGASRGW